MNIALSKRNDGFTIVEILTVIAIIAIMSMFSMPYFQNFQSSLKLNSFARTMASDIRYAQQLTITSQIPHGVQFDGINKKYSILKLDAATTTLKEVALPTDINFQSINFTSDLAKYNSYGAADQNGNVVIANPDGKIITIIVKPSGYVQVTN